MKRSKRQESSIIIYFSFYFILLLALIIFSFSVVYTKVKAIEEKKEITNKVSSDLEILTTKGITYSEFKKLAWWFALNSYQKELLNSVDASFYNENFKNTSKNSYLKFLDQKNKELNNPVEQEKFKKKEDQIIKILPPYSELEVNGANNLLSDFKFINYIENILATFSLDYSNEIWITEINLVEEFSETWKKSKLDTDIYYIPLTLSLEGTKYNIINFLHYVEHVWNIQIAENTLKIHSQNEDNFLYRGIKILLKSDQSNSSRNYVSNYNIYENQLIDLQSIKFSEYLDKLDIPKIKEWETIASRIKSTQWNDKIKIDVQLNFYIKWVQNIKIINHLKSYVTYFNTTKRLVSGQMKNKNLDTRQKNNIKAIQSDINEMSKSLKSLNIAISKQENLNSALKDVANYTVILHSMHSKIWYNVYINNFLTEYKKLLADPKIKSGNNNLYSYLQSIEKDIRGLTQSSLESLDSYNNRLNNKKIFQNVIQIQKNIELKK